ncbi:MAG: hypothetical protein FWH53_01310 [Leptospirales bacterium]|nr:hypothetical protein [Leptospirales bacterium]
MERIIFITIIASASIYVIVRVYRKIKVIINLSKGKKMGDSCCGCSSCSMSDRCEKSEP